MHLLIKDDFIKGAGSLGVWVQWDQEISECDICLSGANESDTWNQKMLAGKEDNIFIKTYVLEVSPNLVWSVSVSV